MQTDDPVSREAVRASIEVGGKLLEYRYRFGLLHQFKEYEKAVWVMQFGRRVKILT